MGSQRGQPRIARHTNARPVAQASSPPPAKEISLLKIGQILKVFTAAKAFRTLLVLAPLALGSLLAAERPAQALLTYYLYEDGPDVKLETRGSLDLSKATTGSGDYCYNDDSAALGFADSYQLFLCTGPDAEYPRYLLTGTDRTTINSFPGIDTQTSETTGLTTVFGTNFVIDSAYVSNTPIVASAIFRAQTLSSMGMTSTGLVGTWSLTSDPTQQIQVRIGEAPPADVPGPLPLFGAAAAFGYSRRLRRRLNQRRVAPSQAGRISV